MAKLRPHGGNSANFLLSERLVLWMNHHASFSLCGNRTGDRCKCWDLTVCLTALFFCQSPLRESFHVEDAANPGHFDPRRERAEFRNQEKRLVRAAGVEPTTFGFG